MRRALALALLLWACPLLAAAQVPVYLPEVVGPQGPEGPQGPAGATGDMGTAGAAGLDTMPVIATIQPVAAASVSVPGFDDPMYLKYTVHYCFALSADDQELYLHTDSDGGASYDASSGNYNSTNRSQDSAGAYTYSNALSEHIVLTEDGAGLAVGSAAGEHICGVVTVEHLGSVSLYPLITHRATYVNASGRPTVLDGVGARLAADPIDAIEFDAEGATTLTGEVRVYGIRASN